MSQIDEVLGQLPIDQIAAQLGADPAEVEQGARAALPALFGGLQANAMDPAGEASILDALPQHDPALVEGGVDLSQVDTRDGEAIAQHIFGPQQDEVVNRLGGVGGGSSLVRKLLPILAPIVLSFLMKQMQQRGGLPTGPGGQGGGQGAREGGVLPGSGGAGGPGAGSADGGQPGAGSILQDVLGSVLGGGAALGSGNTQAGGMPSAGSIITDILGGMLGGGRR